MKKKKKFKVSTLLYLLALAAGVVLVMFLLNMADQYEVVVQKGTGGGKYKVGDTVTVSIDESNGEFVTWELDYGGLKISADDLLNTSLTFEMPEKNVGLSALFKETWTEKTGITYTGVRVGKANDGLGMIEYEGEAVFTNGDTYVGEWHNGKMSGEGLYSWVDENGKVFETYEGEFINDRVAGDGIGTFYDEDGNITEQYDGAYLSGERSGKGVGTLYVKDVVVEKYDGEWAKDVIGGGKGVYEWYDEKGTLVNKFEGTMTATAIDEAAHTYSYEFEGTYYTYDDKGAETSEEVTAGNVPEGMKEVGLAQQ